MTDPRERELDRLEELLGETDDPEEMKEIQRDIRDIERLELGCSTSPASPKVSALSATMETDR